jgi:type II secretory pathway pseudopilin PulG
MHETKPESRRSRRPDADSSGFSVFELVVSMTILLVIMGLVFTLFGQQMNSRRRESGRTDALTSAQAALNVISRETANSGYGLSTNGLVLADCDSQHLHFRTNVINTDQTTDGVAEDVMYYYSSTTQSIVRYDRNAPSGDPSAAAVVNRISQVTFQYYNYVSGSSTPTVTNVPTVDTGRIRVTVSVLLDDPTGRLGNQSVTLISDVTLRNSTYMLNQY